MGFVYCCRTDIFIETDNGATENKNEGCWNNAKDQSESKEFISLFLGFLYISFTKGKKRATKTLTLTECNSIISQLKANVKGSELFGKPRGGAFDSSFNAVLQTFNGEDVYPSISEKAANLLYFVIKDHPFYDGNKRIGALLFIVFLTINDCHLTTGGETKISDRALTALALLIAESNPTEKQLLISLICKLLEN